MMASLAVMDFGSTQHALGVAALTMGDAGRPSRTWRPPCAAIRRSDTGRLRSCRPTALPRLLVCAAMPRTRRGPRLPRPGQPWRPPPWE